MKLADDRVVLTGASLSTHMYKSLYIIYTFTVLVNFMTHNHVLYNYIHVGLLAFITHQCETMCLCAGVIHIYKTQTGSGRIFGDVELCW